MANAQYERYMALAQQYRSRGRTEMAAALERQAQRELEKPAMDISDVAMAEREKYNDPNAIAEYSPAQPTATSGATYNVPAQQVSPQINPASGPWYNDAYSEGQQSYVPSVADQNQADADIMANDKAYAPIEDNTNYGGYEELTPEQNTQQPLVDSATGGNYDPNWNANTIGGGPSIAEQYAKDRQTRANYPARKQGSSLWDNVANTWNKTIDQNKKEELARLYGKGYK